MNKIQFPFQLILVMSLLPGGLRTSSLAPVLSSLEQPSDLARPVDFRALAPNSTGCGGLTVPAVNADYEQQVVELVNQTRAENGLPPLKWNAALTEAARYHSADMGEDDYFEHETYDRVNGSLSLVCDTWERLATFYTGGRAENIAGGYGSPQSVMNGWMESPGHQANILSTSSWEIGVGYYQGSGAYQNYWVQDFGLRSGVYPLIINGEAATTDTSSVSIYIYGDWEEIRLRNEAGSWSAWQPFQASFDWNLSSGTGERTVTAELSSGSLVVTSSDSIYLTDGGGMPALENLPESIQFTYIIPSQKMLPAFHTLTPTASSGAGPFTWSLSSEATFFTAMPAQGVTPDQITVMPTFFDHGTPGIYTGKITLTVTNPAGVQGSPHEIDVTLQVTNSDLFPVFLPGILNH